MFMGVFKNFLLLVAVMAAIFLVGCNTWRSSKSMLGFDNEWKMERYAIARYEKALDYMEQNRFELAQEQFAVVAATSVSPDLRKQAMEAYARADKAIAIKR